MNMQETIASSNDALSHIIRLGRSRARWRMLAVALMAMLAGIAVARNGPATLVSTLAVSVSSM